MSNNPKKKSIKDRLGGAKLPVRRVSVCFRGDLYSEVQQLDEQLRELEAVTEDGRLSGNVEARRLAERIEAARAEMKENTEEFLLQALPRSKWQELKAAHPPRKDEHRDLIAGGMNIETFAAALLPLSVISPPLDDEDWQMLADNLSDRQYEDLVDAAWSVNQGQVSIPFSQAASKIRTSVSE